MTEIEQAFQLLRAVAFVTPAIALLLNLINPLRRDGRQDIDITLFRWILSSFCLLILAGIADVLFLVLLIPPLVAVKALMVAGMLIFLYPTVRLLFRSIS